MAQLDAVIEDRAARAVAALSREAPVVAAYLFGSHVEGRADRWSDIDIAAFVEGLATWSLRERVLLCARIQKEVGDDIELHLLPAERLRGPRSGELLGMGRGPWSAGGRLSGEHGHVPSPVRHRDPAPLPFPDRRIASPPPRSAASSTCSTEAHFHERFPPHHGRRRLALAHDHRHQLVSRL